jgi:hypothetical protein
MKILRTYEFNGHRYDVVELDDGSRIEMKDQADPIKAAEIAMHREPEPDPMVTTIRSCSDKMLLEEVSLRGLKLQVRGEVL